MKFINIKKTFYKVSDFLSWQKAGTINLSPDFQRRSVWPHGAKSFLIDTVYRGLPVPIIFLRDQMTDLKTYEPVREVVDGQQRLRTLLTYIDPSLFKDIDKSRDIFKVKKVHNNVLAGKTFDELSREEKQRILDYEFNVHVLPSDTDDRLVLEVFARMNSTGIKLNNQELRNAEYFGLFKTVMYELALEQLQRWRKWKVFTDENIARMLEVELTSELTMMMIKGIETRSQKKINKMYGEYNDNFSGKAELKSRFRAVMDIIDENIGEEDMIEFSLNQKTFIYSLFAALYEKMYGIESSLKKQKAKKLTSATFHNIISAAEKIQNQKAPTTVMMLVMERRTTSRELRQCLADYFLKG